MKYDRIDYCAYCARIDRLDRFGICQRCAALTNVIELEVEEIQLTVNRQVWDERSA